MRIVCAFFALFFLLLIPLNACASYQIVDSVGNTITKATGLSDEYKARLAQWEIENNQTDVPESVPVTPVESETSKDNGEGKGDGESGLIKGLQTAVEGALYSFTNGVIGQLFEGHVTIFEVTKTGKNNTDGLEMATYKIVNKEVDPFGPAFVRKSILATGALYLFIAFLVLPASLIMLLLYTEAEYPFVEAMSYFTGEEQPYDLEMQKFVCKSALTYWAIAIGAAITISGIRNIAITAIAPHEIVMPVMFTDSIPYKLMDGLANFFNGFESTFGIFGIHAIAAVILLVGSFTLILLLIGHVRGFVVINVISWSLYITCNFIEIINLGSLSVGIELYLHYSNPFYVTVGMICGCGLNAILIYKAIKWTSNNKIADALGVY